MPRNLWKLRRQAAIRVVAKPNRERSRRRMQIDRAETGAARQIYDYELPVAVGQLQSEDEAVSSGRHCLDACAAGDLYRPLPKQASRCRRVSAARNSTGNDHDQSRETDDEHDAHCNNQDFERAHRYPPCGHSEGLTDGAASARRRHALFAGSCPPVDEQQATSAA